MNSSGATVLSLQYKRILRMISRCHKAKTNSSVDLLGGNLHRFRFRLVKWVLNEAVCF